MHQLLTIDNNSRIVRVGQAHKRYVYIVKHTNCCYFGPVKLIPVFLIIYSGECEDLHNMKMNY